MFNSTLSLDTKRQKKGGNVFYDASQNALNFIDNVPAQFGTGNDLRISHGGTDSNITNHAGDLYIRQHADDKDILFQSDNGAGGVQTYFFLDGSAEQVVFEKSARFTDNDKAIFGTDSDLEIFHDGSHSRIKDTGTGNLINCPSI